MHLRPGRCPDLNRHQFRLHGCLLTHWPPNRHWGCLHQTVTRHYRNEPTTVKFLFRQQTSRVVICRTAPTQFVDSLSPCNPVLVTVTLYLDYLLFRYFQYAFHSDVFSIWRKSTEEIHTILYVLGRTLSPHFSSRSTHGWIADRTSIRKVGYSRWTAWHICYHPLRDSWNRCNRGSLGAERTRIFLYSYVILR